MTATTVTGTRRLLLLGGDRNLSEGWVCEQLDRLQLAMADAVLWVADQAPSPLAAVKASQVRQHLGSECRLLVFNAHDGFHPDAFAAAAGTLRGGGDCVVLMPADWPAFDDPDRRRFAAYPHTSQAMYGHFIARLQRLWRDDEGAVSADGADAAQTLRLAPSAASGPVRLSALQQSAVEAVQRVAHGHARRPLVLTADRGRGKSTLLGVAAARLLQDGLCRISVVAPGRAAVTTLFRHALMTAGLADSHRDASGLHETMRVGDGQLCFRVPSEWSARDGELSDLVLVDEAAALPVAFLNQLLQQHNRLVFASTVHGYEGSGRGFAVRFKASLDQHMPQWRAFHLSEPVRWADDDPLEALLNRSLLLDAESAEVEQVGQVSMRMVDAATLATDEPLLRAVFALLIDAHYQTRPSDLRQLLDNPDVRLWLAMSDGVVVGVLLGLLEGGFDAPMAQRVVRGERRPRGHLLPQSLAVHAGLHDCLLQRVLRVQRIAVHADARRRSIGTRLLHTARDWAQQQQIDLLGCAFGVQRSLLRFWQAAGFAAVRLGVRVDPASATHSLFMLHGISARGMALSDRAARAFHADLPWALGDGLRDFDAETATVMLRGRDCADIALGTQDRQDLQAIADGVRQPATAAALMWRVAVHLLAGSSAAPAQLAPVLSWQLQHRAIDDLCAKFGFTGQAQFHDRIRALLQDYISSLSEQG